MCKPYIKQISKRDDGSLIVDYCDGNAHKWQIFYFYSKRDALRKLRQELGIKRNPFAIRDFTNYWRGA